jgi:hypothetical protein
MLPNICFVSNFSKTLFYRKIADGLISSGYKIFWIFVDDFLIYLANNDLFIKVDLSYATLKGVQPIDDFTLNEIIESDRFLRLHKLVSYKYLTNIQAPLYDFINKNHINYVLGERTWGHELLIGRICAKRSELKCKYISLTDIRIPSLRFGFFTDEKETELFEFNFDVPIDDFTVDKPAYFSINDNIMKERYSLQGKIRRLINFLTARNISKDNPTVLHSFLDRLKFGFRDEINRFVYYRIVSKKSFNKIKGKYIFYALHKQPEASIDVLGRYSDDQYINLYNLWRLLPHGWLLLVKEHSNAVGDRPYSFYKRIIMLPGVLLISEKTDSHEVIKNAEITFSVTGTVALESGLMGRRSVTLSKVFFNFLNNVRNMTINDLSNMGIKNIIFNDNVKSYKEYILKNTFCGNVLDPISDPSVLDDENIEKIVCAIILLMKKDKILQQ